MYDYDRRTAKDDLGKTVYNTANRVLTRSGPFEGVLEQARKLSKENADNRKLADAVKQMEKVQKDMDRSLNDLLLATKQYK